MQVSLQRAILLLTFVCVACASTKAQFTAQEDCAAATVLTSWSSIVVPGGTYNAGNITESGSCMFSGETHARWFVFTCTSAGTFNFLVTSANPAADYDFSFWDITTSYGAGTCDIAASSELSCNYAGTTNPTGIGCSNTTCEPSLTLEPCHTYALLVNRYTTGSSSGFTIDFTGTTAGIGTAGAGSVSFTNTPVCIGQTSQFTPSIISTNYNYDWDFGDGNSSTLQSPTHAYTTPGIYPVTLTINAIVPTGCNDSATYTANVFVSAPPGLSVNPTSSNTCPGQSVDLQALTGTTGPTFTWSPASGLNTTTGNAVTASPLGTTTYTVVVTNANGCSAQATAVINVNSTFTISTNPSSATICPGGSTNLSASNATAYTWNPSAGLDVTTGANVVATPSATTSYTVTGNDAAGCMDTAVVVVTVETLPVISIAPTNPVICAGQSESLSASGASTYTWSPGTGLSATTGATVNASPASNETYTVTGTSAGGCTASQTVTLQVLTNPTITVTPNAPTVCDGENVDVTASGAGGYTWTPSTGLGATTGATVNASPTVTTTYTVAGTVSAGCTAEGTVVINVSSAPNINISPSSPSVCNGSSLTLSVSGASSYSWSPSTALSVTTGASVNAAPTSDITYTVIGTNAAGCSSTVTTTVVVNTPQQVTVYASDSLICPGQSATLYGGGSGVAQFEWDPGGGSLPTYNATPSVSTTYTVTGTDANGCSTQATILISVNVVTPITAANTSGLVCVSDSATLQANGATSYNWQPVIGLSNVSGANINASPSVNTTYTVSSIDANGCTSSATVAVDVDPLPVADFSATPMQGCDPLSVQFTNASTNALSSQWFFGDGTTSNLQDPTHSYTIGSYLPSLIVTNTAGCNDTMFAVDSVYVFAPPDALFTVSPDTGILIAYTDADFSFTNLSQGANTYQWNFDDGNTSTEFEPTHKYMSEGSYVVTLVATSPEGCSDVYVLGPLLVDGIPPLFIPNTFTPNNDGVNDAFRVYGIEIKSIRLSVFDRWGIRVFDSAVLEEGWNGMFKGKPAHQGVYVYQAELELSSGKKMVKWGDVTLVR